MRPGRPGGAGAKATIATVAAREPLRPVPAPYPAQLAAGRTVSAQALVAFRGNFYSVAPELAGAPVTVSVTLGTEHCDVTSTATGRPGPVVLARHRLPPPGAGVMVRTDAHVAALNAAAMAAASSAKPHRHKVRIPPGAASRAAADALTHPNDTTAVVVDLARYAAAATGRNTLT